MKRTLSAIVILIAGAFQAIGQERPPVVFNVNNFNVNINVPDSVLGKIYGGPLLATDRDTLSAARDAITRAAQQAAREAAAEAVAQIARQSSQSALAAAAQVQAAQSDSVGLLPEMLPVPIDTSAIARNPKLKERGHSWWRIYHRNRERGLEFLNDKFVPKGQWIGGLSVSYSEHTNDDYEFIVIDGINSNGYTLSVSPMVAYAFKDNLAAGGRFAYKRSFLRIDTADLNIDDLDMSVNNYYQLKQSFSTLAILRNYIPLGRSKRFAVFNEMQLGVGIGQSKIVKGLGEEDMTGTYEKNYELSIGMSPGIVAFYNNNFAVEVSIGVLGFNYGYTKQIKDQVYKGSRQTSALNFKINLFSISLGVACYL